MWYISVVRDQIKVGPVSLPARDVWTALLVVGGGVFAWSYYVGYRGAAILSGAASAVKDDKVLLGSLIALPFFPLPAALVFAGRLVYNKTLQGITGSYDMAQSTLDNFVDPSGGVDRKLWGLNAANISGTGLYGNRPYSVEQLYTAVLPDSIGDLPYIGKLVVNRAKVSAGQVGSSGRWVIPETLHYFPMVGANEVGNRVKEIYGDPRALGVLAYIWTRSGRDVIYSRGFLNAGSAQNHNPKFGCALDVDTIKDKGAGINALINFCLKRNIPVGWITSSNKYWQVIKGKKVQNGTGHGNHKDHVHLDLPRPDWGPLLFGEANIDLR